MLPLPQSLAPCGSTLTEGLMGRGIRHTTRTGVRRGMNGRCRGRGRAIHRKRQCFGCPQFSLDSRSSTDVSWIPCHPTNTALHAIRQFCCAALVLRGGSGARGRCRPKQPKGEHRGTSEVHQVRLGASIGHPPTPSIPPPDLVGARVGSVCAAYGFVGTRTVRPPPVLGPVMAAGGMNDGSSAESNPLGGL